MRHRRLDALRGAIEITADIPELGKAYPAQIFTAVIFGNDRAKFGEPDKTLQGKRICVTGKIELYRGAPEVILHDPEQLNK